MSTFDAKSVRETFDRDGAVHLPGFLDQEWVDLIETGIRRNLSQPGPYVKRLYEGTDREIIMDHSNFRVIPEWQILLAESPIVDFVGEVLGSESLWLFFEQLWVKEPGPERRTPWHQDTTSWIAAGSQACGFWISVDPLGDGESLEYVRGSHLGPLYAGIAFDPYDDTAPRYAGADLPRLPDIEADRASFEIFSFPNTPGDAVMFHPSVLHGGGAGTGRRRTLSLRFFGDDVVYSPRPGVPSPQCPGVAATHRPGDPLRSAWFSKVLPAPPSSASGDAG